MSDDQIVNAVETTAAGGNAGQIRLRDIDLQIDEQGRLVIGLSGQTSLDIFIPGRFTREDIQVVADAERGVIFRVRKRT